MSDPRDVTGVWYGGYDADHGFEKNGFIAVLEELHGGVTGTITEPDDKGGAGVRRASVHGTRAGATLRFVKQYDGTGGWVHAVRYAGLVDGEGTAVAGRWIVQGLTGRFDMQREKFTAEELEDEVAEAVPVGPEMPRAAVRDWRG